MPTALAFRAVGSWTRSDSLREEPITAAMPEEPNAKLNLAAWGRFAHLHSQGCFMCKMPDQGSFSAVAPAFLDLC